MTITNINIQQQPTNQISILQHNVLATDIPTISKSTKEIFDTLKIPKTESLTYPLKEKAKTLLRIAEQLEDAKTNETRYKIFGILIPALGVALIAAGVLLIGSGVALAISLGCLVTLGFTPALLGLLIPAFVISIPGLPTLLMGKVLATNSATNKFLDSTQFYKSFNRVSLLETDFADQNQEIDSKFSEMMKFFEPNLNDLETKLNEEIQGTENALTSNYCKYSETVTKEINTKKEKFTKALAELKKAREFYSQFQNIIAQ